MKKFILTIILFFIYLLSSAQVNVELRYRTTKTNPYNPAVCSTVPLNCDLLLSGINSDLTNGATSWKYEVYEGDSGDRIKSHGPRSIPASWVENGTHRGTVVIVGGQTTNYTYPRKIKVIYSFLSGLNVVNTLERTFYACENDRDLDGIPNNLDDCPDESGPSSNSGCPATDSDNDGVLDSADDCPNESGPSSNNGCPLGNPDLDIIENATVIFSDCSGSVCKPLLSDLGSARHLLNTSSSILSFNNIRVENIGTSNAPSTNIAFYVSQNSTFDKDDDLKLDKTISLTSLTPDNIKDLSLSLARFDFPSELFGNFYLFIVVDDLGNVTESNETNNTASIRVNIASSSGKGPIALLPFAKFDIPEELLIIEDYKIDIFDFTGQKLLSKEVNSSVEEYEITNNLPKGIYIVKSIYGDKKVFVN